MCSHVYVNEHVSKRGYMMDERRTCIKCSNRFPKTDTWAEIDPRTNKTVYVCDKCYTVQQNTRTYIVMRVHFTERMCTLDMMELARGVYRYRVTYHLFDDRVQHESDYDEFDMLWIRDAYAAMNTSYDALCTHATETFMDCDTINQ